MKRLTVAAGLAALALFPADALASTPRATVLSVDARHHIVQLVDAGHLVHAYRYRGRLPRLGVGDRVWFRRSGHAVSRVTRTAPASGSFSFYARVVRATAGRVLLRLADGNTFRISARQVRIQGLTPGVTVLISEMAAGRGRRTITVTLPASAASGPTMTAGDDPSADDQDAEGTMSPP